MNIYSIYLHLNGIDIEILRTKKQKLAFYRFNEYVCLFKSAVHMKVTYKGD